MIEIIATLFMYICLIIEYFILYPGTENVLGNLLCILVLLSFVIFNTFRQNVWILHPNKKSKIIVHLIMYINLFIIILMFVVDVLWKLLNTPLYVAMFLITIMMLHLTLIGLQNYYLNKNKLSWKHEHLLLEKKTNEIGDIVYKKFLKHYYKLSFPFSLLYLFNESTCISLVLVVAHCLYALYFYNQAWKNGYMDTIIYNSEKKIYCIALIFTSIVTIALIKYIPNLLALIIITLPELLLRHYLQRYISTQLKIKE